MAGNPEIRPCPPLELFTSSDTLDPQLQSFLEKASALLCTWFEKAGQKAPLPSLSVLPDVTIPSRGLSSDALLADLQLVMEGAYQPSHPGAIAHLDPPPLTASIAADLICAGLNNNLLADELSPSLSRLERRLCNWFAIRLGLPVGSGGIAASGGSLSNLMALVVARKKAGCQQDANAVVLVSADAHISFLKAAHVMGLASDSLRKISTNDYGQMSVDSLRNNIKDLRSKGRRIFAVVATAGTTVRGAIDPLLELGEVCRNESIWLHIDAAIGGVFALSNSTSHLLNGIEMADSLTLNPQKLLGIPKTSSLLLVANKSSLPSTFSTGIPYTEPAWTNESHGGEMGLQGSRPAEVLKLWIGLRQLGEEGISTLLDEAIARRKYLQEHLDCSKLKVLEGPLHLLSCTPRAFSENQSKNWSENTRQMLLENKLMLSRPFYQGNYYLKAVLGNPHTKVQHLKKLAELLNQSLER